MRTDRPSQAHRLGDGVPHRQRRQLAEARGRSRQRRRWRGLDRRLRRRRCNPAGFRVKSLTLPTGSEKCNRCRRILRRGLRETRTGRNPVYSLITGGTVVIANTDDGRVASDF